MVLDPLACKLDRGRSRIHLRPKEAALLAFFMRNPGRVLSRREIMKEVWDTDYLDDTRTLSVHVRWLRLKIEDDPNKPRNLRTVRGLGYRFDMPGRGG
jgi:DNA-binding response OmpR family regulator